jgi:hypothetical protein
LLKQIAPSVTRAAVLRDATQGSGTSEFAAIQAVAPLLRVEVNPVNVRDVGEIERAVAAFARSPKGGLIVAPGALVGSGPKPASRAAKKIAESWPPGEMQPVPLRPAPR